LTFPTARGISIGLAIAALVLLGGCSPGGGASASPSSSVPSSPVDGIVLSVQSEGLTKVKGFTLRTINGQVLTFTLGTLENGDQFAPGHLGEHQATALPVRVFFRQENGQLVVYRLEDAPTL
jgi:hypothetical protein